MGIKNNDLIVTKIGERGQSTIPSKIREHLGVGFNDHIIFTMCKDGSAKIKRAEIHIKVKTNETKKKKTK